MGQTEFTSTQHIMWKLLLLALLGVCVADRVPSIINGEDVDYPGKYAWQISLQMYGSHICGGSIVSEHWIMTAGHCVDAAASEMSVVVGLHDMRQRYGSPHRHSIKKIHRHASYGVGHGVTPHDIAMIRLNNPITFNEHVQPIPIDTEGDFDSSSECVITGWGYTIEGRYFVNPTVLQEAHTSIITNSECKMYWGSRSIYPGQVCLLNGQTGGCMGDSGGPLACRNGNGDWHLVGVTSWGSAQCDIGMPSVYTRLSYFRQWIHKTSGL